MQNGSIAIVETVCFNENIILSDQTTDVLLAEPGGADFYLMAASMSIGFRKEYRRCDPCSGRLKLLR